MKMRAFAFLMFLVAWPILASDESVVAKLCEDWDNAYIHKNATPLKEILHPDYVGIDEEGTVTKKADEIALIKTSQYIINSISHVEPVDVKVYGSTAIVRTHSKVNQTFKGKTSDLEGRSTIVCLKSKGRWQVVSWHTSKLKE